MQADDSPSERQGYGETLASVYPEGRAWDLHKARSQRPEYQAALIEALGLRYALEVSRCSSRLLLGRDLRSGDLSVRPYETCKRRWCPVCAWRRSLAQWARLVERLPDLLAKHGPVRWILLTLTVRNCTIGELPAVVSDMQAAFRRLTNAETALGRRWPATGWIKALEITFPRPGEAHPHLHVLMAVRPSYFKGGAYVSQAEWTRRWQAALRVDYVPIVDVRRVKALSDAPDQALGEALGGLREVAKYVLKPGQDTSPEALQGLLALKGKRFIDGGGWLRGALRDEDGQGDLPEIQGLAAYWWRAVEATYRRRVGD